MTAADLFNAENRALWDRLNEPNVVREHADRLATHAEKVLKVLRFFALYGSTGYKADELLPMVEAWAGHPVDRAVVNDAITAIAGSVMVELAAVPSEPVTLQ